MNESRGSERACSVPITHLGAMLIRQVVRVNGSWEPFCVLQAGSQIASYKVECTKFPTLVIGSINGAG